jgi:hypothetical protein
MKCLVLVIALTAFAPRSFAETRTAKDMQMECRVALDSQSQNCAGVHRNFDDAGPTISVQE